MRKIRIVKIENCEYSDYEAIRDAIYEEMPFAVIELGYSSKKKIGIFYFHDTFYIPKNLLPYALSIPANLELVKKVGFKIRELGVIIRGENKTK